MEGTDAQGTATEEKRVHVDYFVLHYSVPDFRHLFSYFRKVFVLLKLLVHVKVSE